MTHPSKCSKIPIGPTSGIKVVNVNGNAMAIYITLNIGYKPVFANDIEMSTFLKWVLYVPIQPKSGYCRQDKKELDIFRCVYNFMRAPDQ